MAGLTKPITVQDIVQGCAGAGPSSPQAMYNEIRRLGKTLATFFLDPHAQGSNEEIRVDIELYSHLLRFRPNHGPTDRISAFWNQYFSSFKTTQLYYPEPQFFRDRQNTYIRSGEVNRRGQEQYFAYLLRDDHGGLFPSFSFVPSGFVAATSRLFECFHINEAALKASRLTPSMNEVPAGEENVVILGTPTTSADLIASIERDWPMRTTMAARKNAFMVSDKLYQDETQEEEAEFVEMTKWVVATRRVEASGRVITVLSGHSRSVQGVAEVFTSEEKIEQVKRSFGKDEFPKEFQILFKVRMDKHRGELEIKNATAEKVLTLSPRVSRTRTGIRK